MVYENGALVIDEKSPADRFGDLLEADPFIYSMSLGKSLVGYLMGHAVCQGYVESLDHKLSDWPLVEDTFIAYATVRDVVNASLGHQVFMKNNEEFRSGRFVKGSLLNIILQEKMVGAKPGQKRHFYGQLPAFIALNYISFKTGHKFKDFSSKVLSEYVGLANELIWAHQPVAGGEKYGNIHPNFNATREDTLRIGMAILEDWNQETCVGKYLKDLYAHRVTKGFEQRNGISSGRPRSYAGFFHTDYDDISGVVMGMDGYGGISMLINFDKNRIVYAHAVAMDYDEKN